MKNKIVLGKLRGYDVLASDEGLNCIKDKDIKLIPYSNIKNIEILDKNKIKELRKKIKKDKTIAKKFAELGVAGFGLVAVTSISSALSTPLVAGLMLKKLISRTTTYRFNLVDGTEYYGSIRSHIIKKGDEKLQEIIRKWKNHKL